MKVKTAFDLLSFLPNLVLLFHSGSLSLGLPISSSNLHSQRATFAEEGPNASFLSVTGTLRKAMPREGLVIIYIGTTTLEFSKMLLGPPLVQRTNLISALMPSGTIFHISHEGHASAMLPPSFHSPIMKKFATTYIRLSRINRKYSHLLNIH